jgi:hypothetical protein
LLWPLYLQLSSLALRIAASLSLRAFSLAILSAMAASFIAYRICA